LLPKDDPALRQATTSTVSALTLDNVRGYYQHVFRPDLTTVVVVGSVTPEQANRLLRNGSASWTATGPKPEVLPAPVPTNGPAVIAVPDKSRVQDRVTLAEMLALNRSNPDYYALRLGNFVLGGGFYATRLYRDLRKENGLVYAVDSSFDIQETRGLYKVDYGCDPPQRIEGPRHHRARPDGHADQARGAPMSCSRRKRNGCGEFRCPNPARAISREVVVLRHARSAAG
jgi:zinc protease